MNSVSFKFCGKCSAPLDFETVFAMEEVKQKDDKTVTALMTEMNRMQKQK